MLFSIVIPLYNKEGQIANTLRSVFAQTCTDYEIVIVNDGSTDGSAAAVEAINDPRIRLIHQQNAGVSAARNRGIAEARGQYIALLDADDEWKPEYLATIAELIHKYPDCDVFATNYLQIKHDKTLVPTIINGIKFNSIDGKLTNYFQVAAISSPPIWTSAVTVSKKAYDSIGGFPNGIKSGEDLLTWARLACRYQIAYSKKQLAIFNIEGYSVKENPKRIPPKQDVVGAELKNLYKANKDKSLKHYISLWHKMRASVYMRRNMRKISISEALKGIYYHPANFKLYMYILICISPINLLKRI